jgi:membrane protease YdiL (CAAX protease family)
VLSLEGSGLLAFHSPLDFMTAIGIGTFSGPAVAACIMSYATGGTAGVRRLLSKLLVWRVGLVWYLFALVGVPLIITLGMLVLPGVWASRQPLADPLGLLAEYAVFFIYPAMLVGGPLGEEIGWRGYALPHLQRKYGPLTASLVLGLMWTAWHWPIWFSGQWTQPTLANIGLYAGWLTAMTFIMTWVHNHVRASILMAVLLHTSMDAFPNVVLFPLFPSSVELAEPGCLVAYLGLFVGFGAAALVLIAATRGRLGVGRGASAGAAGPVAFEASSLTR